MNQNPRIANSLSDKVSYIGALKQADDPVVRKTVIEAIRQRLFSIAERTERQNEQLFCKMNMLCPISQPIEKNPTPVNDALYGDAIGEIFKAIEVMERHTQQRELLCEAMEKLV